MQLLNDKDRVRIVKEGQITGQNNTFRMLVDGINRQQNAVAESRLSYTKKNGEKVLVRDKMEKVVTWFTKSQLFEFGNILSEVSICRWSYTEAYCIFDVINHIHTLRFFKKSIKIRADILKP